MKTIIKSIYNFLGFLALTAVVSSCGNEWLDVEPSDGTDAESALKTVSDLEAARTGMYKALKGDRGFSDYYGCQFFVYGDIHAGDDYQYNHIGGSNRGSFYYNMQYATASDFGKDATPWQSPYVTIGRANRIIAAVENGTLTDKDDEDAKAGELQFCAEARVLRALAHFDLVRVYGKPYTADNGASLGVPLVTEVLPFGVKPKRSTVKEVYEQVLKDLNDAISSNALSQKQSPGYVNIWGAKAILSRVYLHMGDYSNALKTAEDVMTNSGASLWKRGQYVDAWSAEKPNESEFLFRLNVTSSDDANDLDGIGNLQQQAGYREFVATKKFVDMLSSDAGDVRNDIFETTDPAKEKEVAVFGKNKVFLNKLRGLNGNNRIVPIIPIIRLSEIYLTAAECAFRTNDKGKAAKYLNALVENRTTTKDALVNASNVTLDRILIERRKELIGEGQRYFDALRNNETIVRYTNEKDKGWHKALAKDAQSFNRDYYKAISAIPQSECNANKEIQQNPEYGK
ncbi:RagB/SusD family nutrient uptake outer membrane protein [Hallella bergensis]|uniref:RagB/SusD family nutrient uptake outer membrane protein n=1 Tax=Hallella bergensis TaxID=242750 RepID=UPI00399092B4